MLSKLGYKIFHIFHDFGKFISFVKELSVGIIKFRYKFRLVIQQIIRLGIESIPIVALHHCL